MNFNEMTHAYLPGKYYFYLKEKYQERGVQAFIHATQYYGMQRGRRMAQKVIADGKELNYTHYLEYGEWVASEELKAKNQHNQAEILSKAPDYINSIYFCPWHQQFVNMGCSEGGAIYCKYLDEAIARGYNPELNYQVKSTMFTGERCLHVIKDGNVTKREGKKMEYVKGFDYHCAHLYFSFKEVIFAIFGEKEIAKKVLEDFSSDYGEEMAAKILAYQDTNFNY